MPRDSVSRKGTKTALRDAVSSQGVCYTVLLELPHFDPIHFPVIYPMQNLFVGTGKHMMEVQLQHPSTNLSKDSILVEGLVCMFVIPEGVGRLPSRMSTRFGGSTADQWRNWIPYTLLYASGIFFLKSIGNAGIYLLKQSR